MFQNIIYNKQFCIDFCKKILYNQSMQKILNLLKTFYIKYTNLKKEYWTHLIISCTYIYYLLTIIFYYLTDNCDAYAALYFYFSTPIYLCIILFFLLYGGLLYFCKIKVKNNFLLENKIYNIIWHIGNILFIFIAILLLYLFT